ncbi:MAG: chemotaxis protein CheA [Bacteroidales bacterium]|nr:chemotaxis protein CheA [Bacteroidales bacterium]
MDQFRDKFLNEAQELLTKIENSLIELEAHPENIENIHEVFRAMHTLKGTSVMFGFDRIGELTHFTESIFDKIREGETDLSRDIVEFTLESVDHIRNLLKDQAFENEANKINQDRLLRVIQQILKYNDPNKGKEIKIKKETKIESELVRTFYVAFEPDEKMLDRGISILSLFSELARLGTYKVVNLTSYNEAETQREVWGIYLATSKPADSILDVFIFVEENVKIVKISESNILDQKVFAQHMEMIEKAQADAVVDLLTEKINQPQADEIEPATIEMIPETSLKSKIQKSAAALVPEFAEKVEANSRIQVDSGKLDVLMYLVSELVTTKARLRLIEQSRDYTQLAAVVEKVEDLSKQFRDNVLEIRLVPVLDMLVPFKRLIRDVSKKLNKKINFMTAGVDTELDKNIIDKLGDPLMHLIRNSIDHGIECPEDRLACGKPEEGMIKLSSYYSGSNVIIKIEDDGKGIDPEKIRSKAIEKGLIDEQAVLSKRELLELIFQPGFSTALEVTDVSGRGVGMDVVKRVITEVRGEVFVDSEIGAGTTIIIKLRQTISITDSLLVKVENTHFLIPLSDIHLCDQKTRAEIFSTNNRRVEVSGNLIPFIALRDQFHTGGQHPDKEKLVIVQQDDKKIALVVDKIIGEHQAVLKPLGDIFKNQEYLSGASVLGDGNLALMLDTNLLIDYTVEQSKLVS